MLLAEREKRALQAALVQIFGQRCRLRQPTGSVILQLRQKKAGEDIRRSRRAVLSEQRVRQLRRQQAERFLYPTFQREPAHIAFQRNGRAFFSNGESSRSSAPFRLCIRSSSASSFRSASAPLDAAFSAAYMAFFVSAVIFC